MENKPNRVKAGNLFSRFFFFFFFWEWGGGGGGVLLLLFALVFLYEAL